jgi:large subunit ribosomal protein L30
MKTRLRITQRRSAIGRQSRQRRTLEALGIRRLHHSAVHEDTPQIRGMIATVSHLVEVETVESDESDNE